MQRTFLLLTTVCAMFGSLSPLSPLSPAAAEQGSNRGVTYRPDVTFTLRTDIGEGKLVFIGETGAIAGKMNPDLEVSPGAVVQINLVNGDGATHDIAIPELGAKSDNITAKGAATSMVFRATRTGTFEYLCTLPGHKAAGMFGRLIVGKLREEAKGYVINVAQDPRAVGEPVGTRASKHLTLDLEATEIEGQFSDKSIYKYWTFNNRVPGPLLRVKVGDTITVNLRNSASSTNIHSIDFHAVTGPGGGAAVTQAAPGETKSFTFKALHPGLFVYHCATPMVAHHIANGMYGMILVEPEGGLPKVDREFYVMQGELYTTHSHNARGLQEFSLENLLAENPQHLMFNGTMDALTKMYTMEANTGDNVRIYFGVGGPNLASSFHIIGEVFDKVYDQASLTSPPLADVQTTLVPPGGATIVEFKVDYPGRYILVDHALSRMEKGLAGYLTVRGEANPEIFKP